MNKMLLTVTIMIITFPLLFILGFGLGQDRMLKDYNDMAGDNFNTALEIFRRGYENKMILLVSDVKHENRFIGDYKIIIIDWKKTGNGQDGFNAGLGNMAAHINGMSVMVMSKWMMEADPKGDQMLAILKELIPNYKISAPQMPPVKIVDLNKGHPMILNESQQWNWRMK